MTRKRFIKLMMAKGIQKNEAQAIAEFVCAYGSYEILHEKTKACYDFNLNFLLEDFTNAVRKTIEALPQVMQTVCSAMVRAAENINSFALQCRKIEEGKVIDDEHRESCIIPE